MPSKARMAFDSNAKDVKRLLELHQQEGGTSRGRRYGLEVLNKSAVVLITSYWEAYCEDIASEGLAHLIRHAKGADALPKELKKQVAKELERDPHELAVWDLSDRGWRNVLRERLERLREERNRKLNTPKTVNINQLFAVALGIPKISSAWHWPTKMTVRRAEEKLDRYVTLRGEIAHRGKPAASVTKAQVTDYFDFVSRLVSKTGGRVNSHVSRLTTRKLWK